MEVALEMEDDLFFADLSKRISLLIMEEEDVVEEEPAVAPHWHHASSLQVSLNFCLPFLLAEWNLLISYIAKLSTSYMRPFDK